MHMCVILGDPFSEGAKICYIEIYVRDGECRMCKAEVHVVHILRPCLCLFKENTPFASS